MSLGPDPNAILGKFLDKQRRQEQFSEDMRKVMYTGPAGTAGGAVGRVRSPGLAAGAALALGATPSSAQEAHSDAHAQCRQAVENARRQTCPFDDHSAFGAGVCDRAKPVRMPLLEHDEAGAALKDARNLGKYNRDMAHKTGAGAPFDAPFDSAFSGNSVPAGRGRRAGAPPAMPLSEAVSGARAEAAANKTRMRGCQDLLGGYTNPWEQKEQQAPRNGSLPPRPRNGEALLPQAMMKLQYDGGSVKGISSDRTAYLNAKVLAEANRDRNINSFAGMSLG